MSKILVKLVSVMKLFIVLAAAAFVTGCLSAKSQPTELAAEAVAPEPVVTEEVVTPTPVPTPEPEPEMLTSWTVVEGNNLWGIACKEEVYNVPQKWPLIYKANLDQIKDADLIYPGQVLTIPRNYSAGDEAGAIQHAKNRGAWAVGPVEAADKRYLQNSG